MKTQETCFMYINCNDLCTVSMKSHELINLLCYIIHTGNFASNSLFSEKNGALRMRILFVYT